MVDFVEFPSLYASSGLEASDHALKSPQESLNRLANVDSIKANSFSSWIESSLEKVNQDQHEANTAIKEMVAGRNKNIHETMLIIEKADLSLKAMMQVRNKIIDAYKEVMRMQV